MGKKLLSLLLSLAMLLTLLPVSSLAAEEENASGGMESVSTEPPAEEDAANETEPPAEETASGETESVWTDSPMEEETVEAGPEILADLPENDELFSAYVDLALAGMLEEGSSTFGTAHPAGDTLTGKDREIYDDLKARIANVAARGGSAVFDLSSHFPAYTLTEADIGNQSLGTVTTVGAEHKANLSAAAETAIANNMSFHSSAIMRALLLDCPYELYWFKKTGDSAADTQGGMNRGSSYGTNTSMQGDANDNWKITQVVVTPKITVTFYVANAYRDGGDATKVTADVAKINTARTNAQEIVNKTYTSDYARLVGYKDEICGLVEYNHDAVTNKETYGNPWQLIWVFDKDTSTNVVCEGYSKAFQYLCDLTAAQGRFTDSSIESYIVSGTMSGGTGAGAHMWNIVSIGGKSYLVDVTNSDAGSVGADGGLFLAGGNGSPATNYVVHGVTYTYDSDRTSVPWDTRVLTLESSNYTYVPPMATSVRIFKGAAECTSDSISVGGAAQYTAKVYDQNGSEMNGQTVAWAVSDGTKATLTPGGTGNTACAVALSGGAAAGDSLTLTATVSGVSTPASVAIAVTAKPSHNLTPAASSQTMTFGDTLDLTRIVTSSTGAALSYEVTSGADVADVGASSGVVSARKTGAARITITAAEDSTHASATATVDITVTARSLASAAADAIPAQTYTGAQITPSVTVRDGSTVLVRDRDYTVSYGGNLNAGQGSVTIAGTGSYSGTKTVSFSITPAAVTIAAVPAVTVAANSGDNASLAALTAKLPTTVTAEYGGGRTADLNVTWRTGSTFNPKGGAYTFTGTVGVGGNFTLAKNPTAVVTVTPVSVSSITGTDAAITKKASEVAGAADLAALGLPSALTVTYSDSSTGSLPVAWSQTLEQLKSLAASALRDNAQKQVTVQAALTLPDWATVPASVTMPAVSFTMTPKEVATVTVTMTAASYVYGDSVAIASSSAKDGETILSGSPSDWTLTYKGTTAAGTAYNSATPPRDAGNYTLEARFSNDSYQGSGSVSFKITPRPVTLSWSGNGERVYDGKASNVTASTGVEGLTAAVTGGDAVDAGTHTAAAALGSTNYAITPGSETVSYTITQAERALTLAPAALQLNPKNGLTGRLTASFSDIDNSGKPVFTQTGGTGAATVSVSGREATLTALDNGTITVKVSLPATTNYQAASEVTAVVTALARPVLAVTAGQEGAAAGNLTAVLDGSVIKVSGLGDPAKVTLALTLADGLTQEPGMAAVIADGGKITVKSGADIVAEYTVSLSGVTNEDLGDVEIKAKAPETAAPAETAPQEVKDAAAALAPASSGLTGAAAGTLVEIARATPVPAGGRVEIEAGLQIEVESVNTTGTVSTLSLDITPVYTVTTTDGEGNQTTLAPREITRLTGAVTVAVTLPAGFPVSNVFARHYLSGGGREILPVTVSGGRASWQQTSFSRVELFSDSRNGSITFQFDNGTTQTIPLNASSLDADLPADTRAGSTFQGWRIGGSTYTKVTEGLLAALGSGNALTAEPQFTPVPSVDPTPETPSSSGGSSSGGEERVRISGTSHGRVYVEPQDPGQGDTVTLTVRPHSGYVLDAIQVTDSRGRALRLTKVSDTEYTFLMPAGRVTVRTEFAREKSAPPFPFADAEDSWARDAIAWAYENGYVNGVSATAFNPNGNITRQQMWMILARLSGANPADMAEAREWGMANGITDGTNGGSAMSRQQMVTFLYRYTQYQGCRLEGGASIESFPDSGSVSSYAREPLSWAVGNGIINGTAAGTIHPAGSATRAQFAVILQRYYNTVLAA